MKKILYSILTGITKKIILVSAIILVTNIYLQVSAQTIGDYRSNVGTGGTGAWTTLATWLRWNGTAWVVPTAVPSGPGWPGQRSGTGSVQIKENQTVTVNNITTSPMGALTLDGTLSLSGTSNNLINTSKVIVNNYVNGNFTNASIYFDGKAYLRLPAGAVIEATIINPNTDPRWLQGSCNNNDEILIGTVAYAVCTGEGNDHPLFSFTEVMINGGTFKPLAKILPDPAITCPGTQLQLDGNPSSSAGTIKHTWSGTGATYLDFTNKQKPIFTCNIAGSYNLKYTVTDGIYTATDDIIVTVSNQFTRWTGAANTSYWNTASNWTCGVPVSSTDVIIPDVSPKLQPHVNITGAVCHDLTLYTLAGLVIDAGKALTVGGDLINNGTFTIKSSSLKDNGSLIVNGTSEGNITYERYITPGKWFIISGPVNVVPTLDDLNKAKMFNGTDYDFATYAEPNNDGWIYFSSFPSLTPGQGYLTRLITPNNTIQFTGELNGDVDLNVTSTGIDNGWNAVGNPFTSALDIKNATSGFLAANQDVFEVGYGAIYIWSDPIGYLPITSSGYLSFSGSGSISDQSVQAGQGFLINVKSDGPGTKTRKLTFKKGNGANGMQVHSVATTLKNTETSWPGITLIATNNGRASSTVVAFNENMTTGLDQSYDAGLLASSDFNLYTHLVEGGNETDFAIQCLPENLYSSLEVPVGLDLPQPGMVTFKASGVILPERLYPVIEDRLLQVSLPLKTENDSLTVSIDEPCSGTGRFFLHIGNALKITGINYRTEAGRFTARYADRKITLLGSPEQGSRAWIYDVNGRKLSGEFRLSSANQNEIPASGLTPGLYLLRIEGKTTSQTLKIRIVSQ